MKRIFLIVFIILFAFIGKSQVYQVMPQYGYDVKRMKFDSTLQIPTFCGVPTLRSNILNKAAIAYDSCNKRFYFYDPALESWDTIMGGGSTLDTTSLSQRIDSKADSSIALQKVLNNGNVAFNQEIDLYDTTNGKYRELYLTPNSGNIPLIGMVDTSDRYLVLQTSSAYNTPSIYFQNKAKTQYLLQQDSIGGYVFLPRQDGGIDTLATSKDVRNSTFDSTSLSNRINLKLSISDTATMLSPYLKNIDTLNLSNRINTKLTASDTTNKWVTSVTKLNDSTIRVIKNSTTTDITLTPSSTTTSATRLITNVYNNTGSTITKGSVVYINGRHSSNLPTIVLAQANNELNSYRSFGLVQDDIATSNSGVVIQVGNITNLNLPTSTYNDGDLIYLSPTTAGGYTTTRPIAPQHITKLGTITRAHPTFGSIEIKIENGWQLDELSDVKIAVVPNDSTMLQFSRVDSLWHDVSVTSAIGTKYLKPTDTASLSTRIDAKQNTLTNPVTGTGTTGAIAKFTGTSTIGNASVDVDYLQQDMSMVAYQAMGSSIKGYLVGAPNPANLVQNFAMGSGTARWTAIYIPKAVTITGVRFYQTVQGGYTANNYNGFGLYSYSGGTLTRVDTTTNDGNLWKGTSQSWQSKAFTNTYSAAAGIYYVVGVWSSSATTTSPSVGGAGTAAGAFTNYSSFDFTNSAKFCGTTTLVTALPSTQAASGVATSSSIFGFYLY